MALCIKRDYVLLMTSLKYVLLYLVLELTL